MCTGGGGGGVKEADFTSHSQRFYCTQKQEHCDRGNFNLDSKASSAGLLFVSVLKS